MSGNENNLILFGRFYSHTEAHIYRGKLENAGIECFIFDDFHSTSAWHIGYAIGGVRLMIRTGDKERATRFIEDYKAVTNAPSSVENAKTSLLPKFSIKHIISITVMILMGSLLIFKKKKP